jgi:hypothetical protein
VIVKLTTRSADKQREHLRLHHPIANRDCEQQQYEPKCECRSILFRELDVGTLFLLFCVNVAFVWYYVVV